MEDVVGSERVNQENFTKTFLALIPKFPRVSACRLANVSVLREYDPGSTVIKEGKPSGGILLLLAGTVDRWMSGSSATYNEWIKLPCISSPAVLGTASCMLGEPSALNVSAASIVMGIFVPQTHLLRVLRESPEAGLAMSQLLSEELAQTYAHLSKLRNGSLPKEQSVLLN